MAGRRADEKSRRKTKKDKKLKRKRRGYKRGGRFRSVELGRENKNNKSKK